MKFQGRAAKGLGQGNPGSADAVPNCLEFGVSLNREPGALSCLPGQEGHFSCLSHLVTHSAPLQ